MRIKKADLGQLIFLAEGSFGKVYQVPGYRLPGDAAALAYKEFTTDQQTQARSAEAAVSFRDGLTDADRDDLDRWAVWPRALVEDKGSVTGLLMHLIPREFFCDRMDPGTGGIKSAPLEMQWLITSIDQRNAARISLPDIELTERLILMGRLVYALGRLHKLGWVFGDLSFRNVVFALNPPRILLMDCDGAAPISDRSRKQGSTLMWDPPECAFDPEPGIPQQNLQDSVTDVYKLGLAILRCLTPGKGASSSRSPSRLQGELDVEGKALIAHAVDADRSVRPTAKELYGYLRRFVAGRISPPAVAFAELATPFCVRGMDARVEWQIEHATKATITAGNGDAITVPVTGKPQAQSFRPDESGLVVLEVGNKYATIRMTLGELTLYELPSFDLQLGYLPRLQVPRLGAFTLDTVRRAFDSAPRLDRPPMPPITLPQTTGLLETLTTRLGPGRPGSWQLPPVADAIAQSWQSLAGSLAVASRQQAESVRQAYMASRAYVESEE